MTFLTHHIPQYRNQILSISGCRPGIHAGFQPFGQPCRSLCGTSLFAAKSGKSFEDGVFAFPSLGRRQKTILHKIFYPCEILTRLVEHCGKTRRQRHEAQAAAGLFGGIRVQFRELQRIGGTILRENKFCRDVVNRNKPRRKHPSGAICPYIRRDSIGTVLATGFAIPERLTDEISRKNMSGFTDEHALHCASGEDMPVASNCAEAISG